MQIDQSIFKAYDIRGIYPEQLNEEAAYNIGRAYATFITKRNPGRKLKIAVGSDMRLSGPALKPKVIQGLLDSGLDVDDIGLISTPSYYFSVPYYKYDGGIQVSASHNPKEYNGMKILNEQGDFVNSVKGLFDLRDMVVNDSYMPLAETKGVLGKRGNIVQDVLKFELKDADFSAVKPLKIVHDASNGMGALDMQELFSKLNCEVIKLNYELDGSFPGHESDPSKPENIKDLQAKVVAEGAALGIASDGDADRYFFVDEKGQTIPVPIARGIMSQIMLAEYPGAAIVYDVPPGRITRDMIEQAGGKPMLSRVGYGFVRAVMEQNKAVFGGESSSHYMFDIGISILECPMIFVYKFLKFISEQNKPVSEIVQPYKKYFHSGNINLQLQSKEQALEKIQKVKEKYVDGKQNEIDGLSVEYPDFWFILRPSNTEPLLRFALEGKTLEIVKEKTEEIQKIINE